MSLADDLDTLEKENNPQIIELQKALTTSQREYSKLKKSREDFTNAVVKAAHDAMLSMGKVPPVPTPDIKRSGEVGKSLRISFPNHS